MPAEETMPLDGTDNETDCRQENVSFVLVRPYYLGNIGSAARALKNFGFQQLALVEPPHNYKDAEARMMAVGAFDVLKAALVYDSLSQAALDTAVLFGTTSGRQRSQNLLSVQEAAEVAVAAAAKNKIAVVFGDEKNGLGNEELALCHHLVHIPTNPTFPALNLAQAVTVVAYELTRQNFFGTVMRNTPPKYTRRELPTMKEENEFFELVQRFLQQIDFVREYNQSVIVNDLRRLYQRMSPNKRELDLVRGALHRLNTILPNKSSDRSP